MLPVQAAWDLRTKPTCIGERGHNINGRTKNRPNRPGFEFPSSSDVDFEGGNVSFLGVV
jgi:hypothetical protein